MVLLDLTQLYSLLHLTITKTAWFNFSSWIEQSEIKIRFIWVLFTSVGPRGPKAFQPKLKEKSFAVEKLLVLGRIAKIDIF